VLLINHLDKSISLTIDNSNHIPIGLCIINHESFETWFWKTMFQHRFIKFCPHDLLNFNVLKLHVTNHYGHHFTISKTMNMANHNYLASNMLHIIKHDPRVLQIPYRLHLCEKAHFTPHTIY